MDARRLGAVILDMDGLMLDTEPGYRRAWQRAAREFGREIDDGLYFRLVGRSNRDAERVLGELFGSDFPMAEFRRRWIACWYEDVDTQGIDRKPGLDELLSWLEQRDIPRAVATSTVEKEAGYTLRRGGLEGRFDAVIPGDAVTRGKPEPDIFLAAADALGVAPRDSVALEDSDAGVLAAAAAGMRVIHVPDLKPPSEEAARSAWRTVPGLDEARTLLERLPLFGE